MIDKQDLYRIPLGFKESNFNSIKENIIRYAKSVSDLKDYDYSGSTAQSFVNVQAYTILKNELMANIAILESNIYTARDRRSVVQHAQNNGYIPSGMMSSKLTISLQCTHRDMDPSIKIPRGTKFQGMQREDGEPFQFVVMNDVNAIRGDGGYYYPIVDIAQGRLMRVETEFLSEVPILIRDRKIDRNQVRVWVDGELWTNWTYNNIVDVTGGSTVYYLRETYDGDTEIRFGVGEVTYSKAGNYIHNNYIGGLKPTEGARVVIEYLRTDGYEANGCKFFTYNDVIKGVQIEQILVNYNNDPDFIGSYGGGDIEDIESIRENGIMAKETQRRAVTDSDWKTILDRRYSPIIQARQIFHPRGIQNTVAVSIKPKGALNLTSDQTREIREYLKQYHMGSVDVVIHRPTYIFIDHDIEIRYSANELMESKDWLEGRIIENITSFYKEDVEFFNTPLHKSKLLSAIDKTHPSIKGSWVNFKLIRELESFYQTSMIGIKFYNKTIQGSFVSGDFIFIRNPEREANEIEMKYNIFLQSAKREGEESVIVAGPFLDGDISEEYEEYTGDDIERRIYETIDEEVQDKYFIIGTIDHNKDVYEWSFGSIGLSTLNFIDPYIEVSVIPEDENMVGVDVGSLLIYEYDLRPQYTNFIWKITE